VPYNEGGLTALVFTSEGDMRQAVNNLQSTFSGFNFVGADEVFKVCDQPHPVKVQALIKDCAKGRIDPAMDALGELWDKGYSAVDIVTTLFRVVKNMDGLHEYIKLEFIRVRRLSLSLSSLSLSGSHLLGSVLQLLERAPDAPLLAPQEIGFAHMRILEGVSTVVQLGGLVARLCKLSMKPELFVVPKA